MIQLYVFILCLFCSVHFQFIVFLCIIDSTETNHFVSIHNFHSFDRTKSNWNICKQITFVHNSGEIENMLQIQMSSTNIYNTINTSNIKMNFSWIGNCIFTCDRCWYLVFLFVCLFIFNMKYWIKTLLMLLLFLLLRNNIKWNRNLVSKMHSQ